MSQRFEFIESSLNDVYIINRHPIEDDRGFFSRFFCAQEFKEIGYDSPVVQINHTFTRVKGAVRGMHFQLPPYTETKVVTCLRGKVFDVAIDLRQGSETFLQWHAEVLSADNKRSLFIPDGFAHGFQALDDNCELIYMHSAFYRPEAEAALNVNDQRLSIEWPLAITDISERDKNHPMMRDDFEGVITT